MIGHIIAAAGLVGLAVPAVLLAAWTVAGVRMWQQLRNGDDRG